MTYHGIRVACRSKRRGGFVLVVVLVVVAVLALSAYTFSELMLSHHESAVLSGRQLQARSLVESGAEYTRTILMQSRQTRIDNGGLFDNPTAFQKLVVIDDSDPRDRGTFTIITSNVDKDGYLSGYRYGLEDESNRLNLNSLLVADKIPDGGRKILMALPGMTEDIADAILDWLDEDDDSRAYGAEKSYYSGIEPAYAPRNGPFQTVEELLLIRGVTPTLLFGRDVNRNGIVDQHEINMPLPEGFDNSSGALDRGWSAYLTLFSKERNVTSDGQPRINLNQEDLEKLHSDLSAVFTPEWANFIVLYRQNGAAGGNATGGVSSGAPASGGSSSSSGGAARPGSSGSATGAGNSPGGSGGSGGSTAGSNRSGSAGSGSAGSGAPGAGSPGTGSTSGSRPGGTNAGAGGLTTGTGSGGAVGGNTASPQVAAADVPMDFGKPSKTTFKQLLDLIGASVQVTIPGNPTPVTVLSPFTEEPAAMGSYMPALMENCACSDSSSIPGRININQAPREILLGIPGLTEESVNEIISRRESEPDGQNANRKFETWIMTELIVTKAEMQQLLPFVCAGGDVFRAQIIGYFQDGSASSRAEVVFDATQTVPRILRWRDVSHLGRGYALETLGVDLADF